MHRYSDRRRARRRCGRSAAWAVACLLGAASLSPAAEPEARKAPVVREVIVRNLGPAALDEGFVRAQISLVVGQPFDQQSVARDTRQMLALNRFSYVNVTAEKLPDGGLRIVYAVLLRQLLVDRPYVTGNEHFRDSRVRTLLGLEEGSLVDEQVLEVAVRKVRDEYHKANYPDAEVKWELDPADCLPGQTHVRIVIDEHRRAGVGAVRYLGNDSLPPSAFRRAMGLRAWYNPIRWFSRDTYDPTEMEMGRLAIRDIYLARGNLDVQVRLRDTERDARGNIVVTVEIDEGQVYRVSRVTLSGVTLFPEADLRRELRLKPGEPASSTAIEATRQALRDYYGSRGYIETDVQPALDPDSAQALVSVHYTLGEGKLTKIRNIHVQGNTRTREKVILRELLVMPGEIYDEVRIRQSERIIQNLGFFSAVRSYPVPGRVEGESDMVLEVEEKPSGQFMVGAGFSSIDKMIGFMEISQGNFDIFGWPYFTGAGQKLRLRTDYGARRKRYELSFTEPWFLDKKLAFGFDLYRSEYDYSEFDVTRTGAALRLGRSLPGPHRLTVQYRLEQVEMDDFDRDVPYEDYVTGDPVVFGAEDWIKSAGRVTLTRDTRDNPFVPTRGVRAQTFAELAGGPFGFDVEAYSLGAEARRYFPLWFGHVLSVRGEYEIIEEYGSTGELPIAERLFIGGGRTLRGFDYRDVGPKAVPVPPDGSHRPYGGRSFALASLEYTVPIVPSVRVAAFYDTGSVWKDAYEFDGGALASSMGVGIRLDLPGFPIRVDHAWVLDKDSPITDTDMWVFWIGYDQ